jgi:hypothetical protein
MPTPAPFAVVVECPECDGDLDLRCAPPKGVFRVRCRDCGEPFTAEVYRVRARRSTRRRDSGWQTLAVRTIDFDGAEHLVRERVPGPVRAEMRQGDTVAFLFDADPRLVGVLNVTVDLWEPIAYPDDRPPPPEFDHTVHIILDVFTGGLWVPVHLILWSAARKRG